MRKPKGGFVVMWEALLDQTSARGGTVATILGAAGMTEGQGNLIVCAGEKSALATDPGFLWPGGFLKRNGVPAKDTTSAMSLFDTSADTQFVMYRTGGQEFSWPGPSGSS